MSKLSQIKSNTERPRTISITIPFCALLLATLFFGVSSANPHKDVSIKEFVQNLIGSTTNGGRFDFESKFICGGEMEGRIVTCFDLQSGIEFQYRREPNVDTVNIGINIASDLQAAAEITSSDGQISIRNEEEFALLRGQFLQLSQFYELSGMQCDLELDGSGSSADRTQWLSLRNPVTSSAIVLIFPDSEFEDMGIAGSLGNENGSSLVGSIIIANALTTPCSRPK